MILWHQTIRTAILNKVLSRIDSLSPFTQGDVWTHDSDSAVEFQMPVSDVVVLSTVVPPTQQRFRLLAYKTIEQIVLRIRDLRSDTHLQVTGQQWKLLVKQIFID